ncbi:MAG: type II toxin-antitoxin system VapC family toxin [Firmicutes bacterium]|nr:type II toxin-antitoxin system VapC family toxin [Bacillota bacterium]
MAIVPIVVDTCVIIDFLKGTNPAAEYVTKLLEGGNMAITAVTVFELRVGIQPDTRRDRALEKLFSLIPVLPFDRDAALRAAQIEIDLRAQGSVIGPADTFIAAICLERGAPLATLNSAHFSRIPGLKVLQVCSNPAS